MPDRYYTNSFSVILLGLILLPLSCREKPTEPPDDGGEQPYTDKIVFSSRRAGGSDHLYVMNPDGSDIKQLTFGKYDYFMPRWSLDGKQIAFASDSSATTLGASLFMMNSDGTNIRPVRQTSSGRPYPGYWPSWSPDEKKIAFSWCVNCEGGGLNEEIFVVDIETGELQQLTNNPYGDYSPDWSPDGAKIVFGSYRDDVWGRYTHLYMMNVDGTGQRRLSSGDSIGVGAPSYSPDGKKLALNFNGSLALFDILTEQFEVLKKREELPFPLYVPRWSPDGQYLVFAVNNTGLVPSSYIYQLRVATRTLQRVLEDSTANWPDWK